METSRAGLIWLATRTHGHTRACTRTRAHNRTPATEADDTVALTTHAPTRRCCILCFFDISSAAAAATPASMAKARRLSKSEVVGKSEVGGAPVPLLEGQRTDMQFMPFSFC